MIEFFCDFRYSKDINRVLKMGYDELLFEECNFCIKIDGITFFEEPLFPILEFLFYYLRWNKNGNFVYNTLESDENPLIEFKKTFKGWKFDSVWKKYDCKDRFELTEFTNAVEKLIDNITR